MSNGLDMNQLIRWGKKLFKLFKRAKKEYDKHQQQQGGQGQGLQQQGGGSYAQHTGGQQQQQWGQQQQHGGSPYPQTGYHQQQAPGAWNGGQVQQGQPHGGKVSSGPYGAHDGPATKDSFPTLACSTKLPLEVFEMALARTRGGGGAQFVQPSRRRWRLTPFSPSSHFSPFSSSFPPTLLPLLPLSLRFRLLSTSPLLSSRPPFRPPLRFYDPSHPSSPSRSPHAPPPPPKPPPPSLLIPLTVFASLPSQLRPSYRTILALINWDGLVAAFRNAGGADGHGADAVRAFLERQNQDMANAQNAHYVELRNAAIREGDLMAKAFSSSKQAYSSGNGEAAHDLSQEGKQHQRERERLNAEAAEWIYRENNRSRSAGEIDLHGLYVQEAIEYTEKGINNARSQGLSELRVIVGKGNHSPSHVAKIKPAITSLMQKERLTASLDPHNGGVLVVQLQGQGGGRGAGQFMREMEDSRDNDCVVM
ncbi:hypothetical protein JCM6882_000695 [Rhodosporidiobolus microsporus]